MEYLIIIIAILVGLGAGGGYLLVSSRRHRGATLPPPAPKPPATGPAPTDTDERAGAGGGGLDLATEAVAEPAAPEIEVPPPSAGRMVRLRGRLARSQSAFGSVLLGLLSRDTLDDAGWEEIEDTLITADVGVAPARHLVEQLRTEVKVTGSKDVRSLLRAELQQAMGPSQRRPVRREGESSGYFEFS